MSNEAKPSNRSIGTPGVDFSDRPTIVFLHGLARTHRSLQRLRRQLAEAGYPTWAQSYPSRRFSVEQLAETMATTIIAELQGKRLCAVTHSMGAIILRAMAGRVRFESIVMLAPPNQGSSTARVLKDYGLYRWFYGPAGQDMANDAVWPTPQAPFGVIAGTAGVTLSNFPSLGIQAIHPLPSGEVHDGTLLVRETKLAGMADFLELPASHTFIMNHPQTASQIRSFIENGAFY